MDLREWRKANNVTVRQLAERCGVSEAAIRHYETGIRKPHAETAQRIEGATQGAVTAVELLNLSRSSNFGEDPASFDHALRSEAKALGLDPDAIAKKAVEDAVKRRRIDAWFEANRNAMEANAEDVRKNGLWSDGLRLF